MNRKSSLTSGMKVHLKRRIDENLDIILCRDVNFNSQSIQISRLKRRIGHCQIYKCNIHTGERKTSGTKTIVIKQLDGEMVFLEHRKLFNSYRDRRPVVPEPYFHVGKGDSGGSTFIAMDFVPGKSLLMRTILSLVKRSYKTLTEIFMEIGSSLANFHEMSISHEDPVNPSSILDEITTNLGEMDQTGDCDKETVREQLAHAIETLGPKYKIPVARSFNDWTPRNMIINDENEITLINTDAMTHPLFPSYNIIWNDIATFILNIESQTRYSPLLNRKHILALNRSFLDGYKAARTGEITSVEINTLLFISILRICTDEKRPFKNKFKGWICSRYVEALKEALLRGHGSIFGGSY